VSQSTKETRYYQFPLCLLQLPLDNSEFVQHVVSYTLVNYGRESRRKLRAAWGEEEERDNLDNLIQHYRENPNPQSLPRDFNEQDWRHLAIFAANTRKFSISLGGCAYSVNRYETVRTHLEGYRQTVGDGKDDRYVRFRHDLVWDQINTGKMSLRELRVLAGFYAAIADRPYYRISLDWLRYLSAGFKSKEAYERMQMQHAGDGTDLNKLGLPAPPPGFKTGGSRYSGTPNSKADGYFRYDEARAYWQQHEAAQAGGVPLGGGGGMFEVLLTDRGAIFKLRPEYFPADGSAPTTGRTRAGDFYSVGEPVVFDAGSADRPHLVSGIVEGFNVNYVVIRADGGKLYREVRRTDGRPAPAHYFSDLLDQAGQQKPYGPELLTDDKLRTTRDKLLDLGWLYSYYDGRFNYYSHRLNREEIADKVEGKKVHRLNRQIEEETAKQKARRKVQRLQDQLADLKAGILPGESGAAPEGDQAAAIRYQEPVPSVRAYPPPMSGDGAELPF